MNIELLKQRIVKIDEKQVREWKRLANLRKQYVTAIYDMVKVMGGEVFVNMDDDYPIVTYDGGNHAEYASTICGVVTKISAVKENGKKSFTIDIDGEEGDYNEDRLNTADVGVIFDYICGLFETYSKNIGRIIECLSMFKKDGYCVNLSEEETESLQLYDGVNEDGEDDGELHGVVAITENYIEMDNGEKWNYYDLSELDFEKVIEFLEEITFGNIN